MYEATHYTGRTYSLAFPDFNAVTALHRNSSGDSSIPATRFGSCFDAPKQVKGHKGLSIPSVRSFLTVSTLSDCLFVSYLTLNPTMRHVREPELERWFRSVLKRPRTCCMAILLKRKKYAREGRSYSQMRLVVV